MALITDANVSTMVGLCKFYVNFVNCENYFSICFCEFANQYSGIGLWLCVGVKGQRRKGRGGVGGLTISSTINRNCYGKTYVKIVRAIMPLLKRLLAMLNIRISLKLNFVIDWE